MLLYSDNQVRSLCRTEMRVGTNFFNSFMLYNVNDVRRIFHEKFKFRLFRFYRVFFLRCIATLEFHQFHFLREKRSSTGFDEPSSTVIRNT